MSYLRHLASQYFWGAAYKRYNAQAAQMKGFVEDMVALVGGASKKASEGTAVPAKPQAAVARRTISDPAIREIAPQTREVKPEQVIPLDDDDFKDF